MNAFFAALLEALARKPKPFRGGTPPRNRKPRDRAGDKADRRAQALANHERIQREGVPLKYLHSHARKLAERNKHEPTGTDGR